MSQNTQRRFATVGDNMFSIANAISKNQKLCRLLKYTNKTPFSTSLPDVNGVQLINKQILIVPRVYDQDNWKTSFIIVLFDDFVISTVNPDFKTSTIRFDILCPLDEWIIEQKAPRPFLIMQELDSMFNHRSLSGMGTLQFQRADNLLVSTQLGGYSMRYKIHEFN